MKLIDVTNSYPDLVNQQLANTDATFIRVFTLGKTTVIYTEAPSHNEIVIVNKQRNINQKELAIIRNRLIDKNVDQDALRVIELDGLTEISIPIPPPILK